MRALPSAPWTTGKEAAAWSRCAVAERAHYPYAEFSELAGPLQAPPADGRVGFRRVARGWARFRAWLLVVGAFTFELVFLIWLLQPAHYPEFLGDWRSVLSRVLLVSVGVIGALQIVNVTTLAIATLQRPRPGSGDAAGRPAGRLPDHDRPRQGAAGDGPSARSRPPGGCATTAGSTCGCSTRATTRRCVRCAPSSASATSAARAWPGWNQDERPAQGAYQARQLQRLARRARRRIRLLGLRGHRPRPAAQHGASGSSATSATPTSPSSSARRSTATTTTSSPAARSRSSTCSTACCSGRATGSASPMFVGTNNAVRISALRAIGGLQDSITEDVATSVVWHAPATRETGARWKSVYTPDVLAVGEGPSTWRDYFTQQHRWACGADQTILRQFRRSFWRLVAGRQGALRDAAGLLPARPRSAGCSAR